jgi:epoxide hydrolase-like predicted phosphatase
MQQPPESAAADVVVFDYGGVLTTPVRDSITAWLERDGIDPASFSRMLKAWLSRSAPEGTPIHRLETGELSISEFDALLAAELVGANGQQLPTTGLLKGLFADMRPDSVMFGLVGDLKNAGIRVALLSNSWGNTYPREQIDALFDPVVVSSEVGMRKPNPEIFMHILDLLDVPPDRVIFVDDAEPNTDAASRLGMHTVLHTHPDSTRKELGRFIPALSTDEHMEENS